MSKECDKLAKVQRKLSECRDELTAQMEMAEDFDGQRRALADRLAAAEAREKEVVDLLRHIPQIPYHQHPNRGWVPGGSLTIGAVSEAIDMVREKLHNKDHTALDAALVQREIETEQKIHTFLNSIGAPHLPDDAPMNEEELDEIPWRIRVALEQAERAGVESARKILLAKQDCGHPLAVREDSKNISRCFWCESLEQARADGRETGSVGALVAVEQFICGNAEDIWLPGDTTEVEERQVDAVREVFQRAQCNAFKNGERATYSAAKAQGVAEERERLLRYIDGLFPKDEIRATGIAAIVNHAKVMLADQIKSALREADGNQR